jgi:hypothetical protein
VPATGAGTPSLRSQPMAVCRVPLQMIGLPLHLPRHLPLIPSVAARSGSSWSMPDIEVGDQDVGVLLEREGDAEHVQLVVPDGVRSRALQAVVTGEDGGVGSVWLDDDDLVGEVESAHDGARGPSS